MSRAGFEAQHWDDLRRDEQAEVARDERERISARHTPGPWIVTEALGTGDVFCGYEIEQLRPHGDVPFRGDVARVNHAEHIQGITRGEAKANAQLIAAAPELLDGLAEAAGTLAGCADILRREGHNRTAAMVQTRHEQCLALLVKATKGGPL